MFILHHEPACLYLWKESLRSIACLETTAYRGGVGLIGNDVMAQSLAGWRAQDPDQVVVLL